MINDQLVFIVDLNEVENGDRLPVSMDYTCNAGEGFRSSQFPQPAVGEWVYVHSDDDNTLYWAKVLSVDSERDLIAQIDWASRYPILNRVDWSAQDISLWSRCSQPETAGSDRVSVK